MTKAEASHVTGIPESHIREVCEVETRNEVFSGVRDDGAEHDHVVWLKNGIGYYVRDGRILKRL